MWDTDLKERILNRLIPEFMDEVVAINDRMAKNPEIGGQEHESSLAIVEALRAHGAQVEYPFMGIQTAFKACINKDMKNRVAILVEYDALRDIGHACGHCASGCASLLAGLALNRVSASLDVGIDIIGTPDEEFYGQKCVMAKGGAFDGYMFAAMVHMGGINTADVDFIALDGNMIKFFGAPAHAAAAPEKGRNALNAARLFFDATDMMRQHVIPGARLHGFIKHGGAASNIVPDYTEIEFLTRAPTRSSLSPITEWVHDCARAAAMATRTTCEITEVCPPFHDLYISPSGRAAMLECFDELGLPVTHGSGVFVGSSDIGNVDYVCPAFHPIVSIGQNLSCHTREFAEAMTHPLTHRAIGSGAQFLVSLIFKLCGDKGLLQKITEEHKAHRNP